MSSVKESLSTIIGTHADSSFKEAKKSFEKEQLLSIIKLCHSGVLRRQGFIFSEELILVKLIRGYCLMIELAL
jgi:hypothetical protein